MPCNIMTEMYPQDSVAGSPYPSGYAFLLRESDLTVEADKVECNCRRASYYHVFFVSVFLDNKYFYICLYLEIPDLYPEACMCIYVYKT